MKVFFKNFKSFPVLAYRWTRVHVVPTVLIPYDYATGFIAGIKDSRKK